MGWTFVKLLMIIVPYVYKKPVIIINHKSKYKFQMCKKDEFTNLKFDNI